MYLSRPGSKRGLRFNKLSLRGKRLKKLGNYCPAGVDGAGEGVGTAWGLVSAGAEAAGADSGALRALGSIAGAVTSMTDDLDF